MERINQFSFYEIGQVFQRVEALEGDTKTETVFWPLIQADTTLKALLDGKPIPLGISSAKAHVVAQRMQEIFNAHINKNGGLLPAVSIPMD